MNTKADSAEFAGTAVASDDLDLVHASICLPLTTTVRKSSRLLAPGTP
jgi:hypothetical protein